MSHLNISHKQKQNFLDISILVFWGMNDRQTNKTMYILKFHIHKN